MNFKSIKEDQKNFRSNTYKYSVPLQVKRKISAINTGIEYLLNRVYTVPKICENYVSYDEFIQVISEAIAERIYLYFFSDLDDSGDEWGEIYNGIMKYVDIVWGDRLESYFEKNCNDEENINLQEQIYRIQEIMGNSKASKIHKYIYRKFDKVFDKLKLERTDDDVYQYDWFYEDRDFVKVFERNDWGRFWIYGCDEYRELLQIGKLFKMSFDEFEAILINYLNERYKSEFEKKPLKDIGNENCVDDDFFFQENIQRIKEVMGIIIESDDIRYTDPNFDVEWGEAERYIQHPNLDKRITWTKYEWLEKVKNGRVVSFSEIEDDLENFSSIEDFEHLVPEKIERFIQSFSNKVIELPIAVKLPNGKYDLIAGNTRLTGLRKNEIDPKIWVFNI
jgi:hypothetical protein